MGTAMPFILCNIIGDFLPLLLLLLSSDHTRSCIVITFPIGPTRHLVYSYILYVHIYTHTIYTLSHRHSPISIQAILPLQCHGIENWEWSGDGAIDVQPHAYTLYITKGIIMYKGEYRTCTYDYYGCSTTL